MPDASIIAIQAPSLATVIGGTPQAFNPLTTASMAINSRGDQRIAQSLPPKSELARLGLTYSCAIATASAFTYVNAWPTTRAELVIYNGEPGGGKSYVIDSVWMVDISTAAAAQSKAILAQLVPTGATAPTDATGHLITSRSARGSYGANYPGRAKRDIAQTACGQTTNRWEIVASTNNVQAASIGASMYQDLYGGWIVPPTAAFALAGLASTAAGTAIIGVTWHEVQLDLG